MIANFMKPERRQAMIVGAILIAGRPLTGAELYYATGLLAGALYRDLIWLEATRVINGMWDEGDAPTKRRRYALTVTNGAAE